jgi:hypothetical protein
MSKEGVTIEIPRLALVMVVWLVLTVPDTSCIAGHFSLAFQRKLPAWENSAGTGCIGGRATRVWIWDESGRPVSKIQLRTTWNVLMGETDTDGRCQISYNTGIGFDLVCVDDKGSTSDIAYLMTSELEPCRNFHSYEVGFLYKTSITNRGTFDTTLYGTWPQMNGYCDGAPYTKSLAYNSVDYKDYWSDQSYWGNWQNPPSYFGQTFVATGDRVVAVRVQGTVGGNNTLDWKLRIVTFPMLKQVGPIVSVPERFPFGWEAFWGVNDCPVIPGQTYMVQVWRDGGGMNIFHITKNVYPYGQYYEGTTAYPGFDLNGHICCMNHSFRRAADFNGDGYVNLKDFCKIAQYWLEYEQSVDIAPPPLGDKKVDLTDIAALCEDWLTFPGAMAYWKLDEIEGSIAHDSIGGKDGTAFGQPLWQPVGGKLGGALLFDGVDDYVSTPYVLNPANGEFSVFTWVKGGGPGQVIISQMDGGGTGAVWLWADPLEGRLTTSLTDGNRFTPSLMSLSTVADGHWHYIGVVWDGLRRHLYMDGLKVAEDASDIKNLLSSDGGLYFGVRKTFDSGSFWCGLVDDIRIYERALTP